MSQINQYRFMSLVRTLTGNAGGAVGTDAVGNLNVLGDTTTINIVGTPLTNTLTVSTTGAMASSYLTDDANSAIPALGVLTVAGGTNIGTTSAGSTVTINLDDTITLTTVNATTFDTNVAAAAVTLSGTSLIADGTDANIDLTLTAKGTGHVVIDDLNISGLTAGTLRSGATGNISSLADGADGTLLIGKTGDVPIWAVLTDGNNITSTEGANSISVAVTGTTEHGVQIGSAAGALTSLAVGTDGQVLLGSNAADAVFGTLASADGTIAYTLGAGTLDISAASGGLDHDNILYVGKHGDDAKDGKTPSKAKLTIQSAITAAVAGDTVIVYPGEYAETVTHVASNVTIIGKGKPSNCIISQADANVIDFAGYTGIQYKYFQIKCTAATTAIWTITGTTGQCSFKECQVSMTTAANIAAVAQPGIGRVTGAGTLILILGKAFYYHTGNGGATGNKGAFSVGDGGMVSLSLVEELEITNSGTALVTGVGIDTASTGNFTIHDCIINITDPGATIVTGLAYLGGTGTDSEFYRNTIHVVVTNNTGYGFFSADTASTSRFFFNHIHVTDVAGASYSYLVGATATVTAIFDDVVAADGANVAATGIFYEVKSPSDGDLICSGPEIAGTRYLTVANTDNTATASNSAVNVSVGGATSTGDPYTNYLVTGAGTYSVGIDNTDSDNFKITSGATPSAGTDLLTMTSTGVITLNNDLDVSQGGTGVSTLLDHGVLVGSGAADITALAVGGANTALLGSAAADPVWGTVPNATLSNSSVTLSNGNNITVTGSPLSLGGTASFNLTGTTQHAIQLGDATGSLDSLGIGTTGQILQANTTADPTWSTATYPSTAAIGTILVASGANVITTLAPDTAGHVLTDGGAGVAPSWAAPTLGTVTSVSGGTNISASGTATDPIMDLDATITLTTVNATTFDTNVAAAGVTLAGTSLIADGTDADISINITAKGTGQVIIDDLQLTTDLTVPYGGTGVSTFTDGGLLVGAAAGPIEALAVGGVGTILTGVAASNPTWTTATYPATVAIGDVLVASANNVIGVQTGGTTAGHVLMANGAASAPTFQAVPIMDMTWSGEAGTTIALLVSHGYITQNAGLTTLTLPATAALGTTIAIVGEGAGKWKIAQRAGQSIRYSGLASTVGVGGYVSATNRYDTVYIVCRVADTIWTVVSATGVLDVV